MMRAASGSLTASVRLAPARSGRSTPFASCPTTATWCWQHPGRTWSRAWHGCWAPGQTRAVDCMKQNLKKRGRPLYIRILPENNGGRTGKVTCKSVEQEENHEIGRAHV